jgi:DNA-binding LacI/PurR family transcriptional regulator
MRNLYPLSSLTIELLNCGVFGMTVTLRDIARQASVSSSTVSRVLNDYPYIGDDTRQAVWQAAKELGYSLENLRTTSRQTRSVLLLARYNDLQPDQDITLAGIERALSTGAQSVFDDQKLKIRLQRSRMDISEFQSDTWYQDISGIMILGGMVHHDFLRMIEQTEIPLVVAGSHVRPLQIDSVMADYADGMKQAISHMACSGRQRIGLVNGSVLTSSSAEKYNGYRLGLALHDLASLPGAVINGDFTPESGYTQTRRLLAERPDLDAIAYGDDNMAFGGLSALKEMKRRVPEDVAITGFHDYQVARFTDPPLTTVAFDMSLMGKIAARRLCHLIDEPGQEAFTIVVPIELVTRASA